MTVLMEIDGKKYHCHAECGSTQVGPKCLKCQHKKEQGKLPTEGELYPPKPQDASGKLQRPCERCARTLYVIYGDRVRCSGCGLEVGKVIMEAGICPRIADGICMKVRLANLANQTSYEERCKHPGDHKNCPVFQA